MLSRLSIFSFYQMLCFHGRLGGKQHVPVLHLQQKSLALSLKQPEAQTHFLLPTLLWESRTTAKITTTKFSSLNAIISFHNLNAVGPGPAIWKRRLLSVFIFILSSPQKGSAGHSNQQCGMMQADTEKQLGFVALSPVSQDFCG